MFKFIFIILLSHTIIFAKSYTIYFASTKYLDVAKEYYNDIKFHIPDFYDVTIRTHVKKNYSIIIRQIPTIEKAIKVQKLLHAANKYNDSYIKKFNIEPSYTIINMKENKRKLSIKEKIYKQDIETSNEYITASTMYNTQQYKDAYTLFYKLFLKNNYNLNINYFLAKSAFKLNMYDEATSAFERVLIANPNFNQARYDYARILYLLKQNEQSKKEFSHLLNANITENKKIEIKKYLKILNKKRKTNFGNAAIMIGFDHSSNVNNGLITPSYKLPGLNDILVEGEDPISDNSYNQMVTLNFLNYFETKPLAIKNSFLIYNKNYVSQTNENITIFSYKPSIIYFDKKNKSNYTLEFEIDRIHKRTEDDFYIFAISPKYSNKLISTYLKYQSTIYIDKENEEKDFEKIQLFASFNLFKNMDYYTNIYKNKRQKDLRTDIDKYTIANGINLFYNINEDNLINLNYQFDYSKYKFENFAFNSKRKDENHSVELSLKHNINKTNIINFATSYTKNNSNQDSYVYDVYEIRLNYLKSFSW